MMQTMSDRSYYILFGVIVLGVAADMLLRGGIDLVFLIRKLMGLVDYLVFWR